MILVSGGAEPNRSRRQARRAPALLERTAGARTSLAPVPVGGVLRRFAATGRDPRTLNHQSHQSIASLKFPDLAFSGGVPRALKWYGGTAATANVARRSFTPALSRGSLFP